MDYNENDSFQSQNHHIAGEGSNKFPPVLRPYALPKFDFDDSLQGHLRFDSLVESEVFLGIENNEDSRWIEDYSRGSCGIEFSKSRIDSCNVSRCNNVWSEATSSESVEMLLKSVGQEEIITTQSVAEVSDAFDELSCLTKSMEPDLKHDTVFSKIGDVEELQSAFPLDGVPENSSKLKDDYQEDQSLVEGSLQTDCGESSIGNNLGNSDRSVSDQCLLDDSKHMVVTATDVSNLVDEVGKENLTCTDVHMDDVICSMQNIVSDTVKKSQEDVAIVDDVSAVSDDGLQKDSALSRDKMNDMKPDLVNHGVDCENMNNQNLDREAHESTTSHSVNPVILSSATETIDEQNDSRPYVSAPMEPSVVIVEQSFVAETLEGCADGARCGETSQAILHENDISFEDASVSVPVEASDVVADRISDAEKLEGGADEAHHGEISQASQHEDDVSFKDATVTGKLEENISTGPAVVNEGNKETDSNIEEVCNVTVKQLAGNEQAADPPEEGTDERSGNLHGGQLVIENVVDKDCGHSDSGTSLHSVVDKVLVNDGDGSKGCASMELPMEAKVVDSAFEGSKVDVSEMDVDSEIPAELPQQTLTGEKLEGSILDARSSDSAVCQEQSKQLISGSGGPIDTDSAQTVTIEKLEGNILDPHSSDFADVCQEQSKPLSGSSSEDGQTVVTDSQPTVPMEKLEGNIPDSRISDAVDACQEQNKQFGSGFCSEDGGPVLTDECLATSTPNKPGSTENVSDCTEVQKSVEVALGSTHSRKGDVGEASPKGDVATSNQNTDTPEAIKHSPVHEPTNGALSGNQDLSLHDTTSDCLPKEEGAVDTKSNNEPQLTEAQAQVICPGSVEDNIPHVLENDGIDVDTIVTSPEHKEATLADNNKLEFEVSGDDVSKTPQSTSTPVPLFEGGTTACVLKDGNEQADADETISASITVNETSNLSVNRNEDVVESLSAKDIGVSEVKGDPAIDNPQVSSRKDMDTLKTERSSAPQIVDASPLASGSVKSDHQTQQGVALRGGSQASKENTKQKPKGAAPERKARRTSAKAAGRESARKAKDSTPSRQSETGRKPANLSISSPGIYQFVQSNDIIPYGQVDGSGTKSFGVLTTTPTSRLPDLNSTAYPSLVFQQPFTDSQQVELRAQIFVYGSLISKQVPEESHMVSAFGGPDGSRSMWEKAWKVFKARTPSQPSPGLETPSRSGNVASDSAVKQKALSTPIVRSSTSATPSSVVNPMIPLSSPLWNIPTPSQNTVQSSGVPRGSIVDFQQAFSQMASQQTPPIISYVGPSNTSWMSQTPFRGPWAASPQATALDTSVRFPSLLTETVQLTPVRESSLGLSTSTKHAAPVSSTQGGGHAGGLAVSSASHDLKRAMGPSTQPSTSDRKVKRRRKGSTSEDPAKISVPSQLVSEKVSDPSKISLPSLSPPQLTSLLPPQLPLPPQSVSRNESVPVAACTVSTPISAAIPANFVTEDTVVELNVASPPSVAAGPVKGVDQGPKKPILSEDAICKEKEARQQAEDASTLAVAAVSHSQEVWGEIYKKQNSGLMPATEAKLASAAVAIAAAAAVAKAAAAAANVASNAALQAKLMADEALSVDSNTSHEGSSSSSSIITAAKEAARRRVQAASAAALRADNLDAIVKAAELAAEAISQAGKVVAMGDPLTLRKLAEAGPDGFWKLDLVSPNQAKDGNTGKQKADKAVSGSSISIKSSDGTTGCQEADAAQQGIEPASQENFRNSKEEELRLIVGISGSVTHSGKDTRGQQFEQSSDPAVSASVNLESESVLGAKDIEMEKAADPKIYNGIREGSIVEVFKDGDEYKGAWFSAKVMNLKDGKAHVCYSEISSTEGSGKLDEWIDLTSEEGQAPKIRVPHPMTAMQYEGSRKRRRAAVGYLTCSVGDKVDAWIRDSWWEAVVTEKNRTDETSLTVSLPALGETSAVKAWNLRPSLIWRDGEWVEWSYARETGLSHRESDTPKEKRPKLGTPANETKDKDSKAVENPNPNPKLGKPEESKSLDLSDKEKSFNVGTSIDKRKPEIGKPARPGTSRKEGPGAIFGVPKPGKKRKFMDVSKHYDGEQDKKVVEVKDSVKLANYMMPRGTGPRGPKSSKVDPKEKQGAQLKSKGPKSVGSTLGRGVPQRNNISRSSESASEDSAIHAEEEMGKNSRSGTRSFSSSSKVDSQGPFLFSSQARKTSGAASKSETGNRGRFTPAAGKLTKIEENKTLDGAVKLAPNPSEPARRSVRRIQPTSRLLEGLQSSLLISKIPSSSSHDKSHRPTKTVPKGKNQ